MKKICNIPYGILFIIFQTIFIIIFTIQSIVINEQKIIYILATLMFLMLLLGAIKDKYHLISRFSEEVIIIGGKRFTWDEVYITMFTPTMAFRYNAYFFCFDDRYYSKEGLKHNKNKWVLINMARLKIFLSLYRKKVEILEQAPFCKKILDKVKKHNAEVL